MKKLLTTVLVTASLLTACAVVPAGRHGHGPQGVVVAPLLPAIVVLDVEPFYFQSGFYYHYDRGRWYYARSKRGPWADLPRDRYPREVRFKGKNKKRDKDRDRDGRDHDDRRYDDWHHGD